MGARAARTRSGGRVLMIRSRLAGTGVPRERGDGGEALARGLTQGAPLRGQLVIPARRALLALCLRGVLPLRRGEAVFLEPAEDRVDGAAGEPRGVEDVEPVAAAARERVEHEGGRGGQARHVPDS